MLIGLVLPAVPGYSETFFKNQIRIVSESDIRIVVFANGSKKGNYDFEMIAGFSWTESWFNKIFGLLAAFFRLARSPVRAAKLMILNKKSGYANKKNLISLLTSAHILQFNPDWLHFGFATTALGKENVAAAVGAKMAASIRGFDIAVYPLKHRGCYELLWRRLDKLHYISDDLFARAEENGFVRTTEHKKITPAVGAGFFKNFNTNGSNNTVRILTVARLHWIKGLEYTLAALKLVKEHGVDFEYMIIGEGKEYERLIFAAHQMDLLDKVHFVGKKSPEEITIALNQHVIYLQYSIHEGFCNAVLEAQAAGMLTIVSDAGALAENIVHDETGWVVPRRSPKLLADQILSVLRMPESDRTRITNAAMARARSQFDLQKQKEALVDFYR